MTTQPIISRDIAKSMSLREFFTGQRCANGHLSVRLVSSGACKECRQKYYEKNKQAVLAKNKEYRANNREKTAAKVKEYAQRHAAKMADAKRRYALKNPEKVKLAKLRYKKKNISSIKERNRIAYEISRDEVLERRRKYVIENSQQISEWKRVYRKENRGIIRASNAKRRARKIKATPLWADFDAIKSIYIMAGENGLHVDHIIPLHHPMVCGLHVENNLEPLTWQANLSKGNKFNPDEFYVIFR